MVLQLLFGALSGCRCPETLASRAPERPALPCVRRPASPDFFPESDVLRSLRPEPRPPSSGAAAGELLPVGIGLGGLPRSSEPRCPVAWRWREDVPYRAHSFPARFFHAQEACGSQEPCLPSPPGPRCGGLCPLPRSPGSVRALERASSGGSTRPALHCPHSALTGSNPSRGLVASSFPLPRVERCVGRGLFLACGPCSVPVCRLSRSSRGEGC